MLKRLVIFLLISAVVCLIAGLKSLSWRPDIVASITGKDFLLNTPLADLVDIEKLYSLPEDNVNVALLKVQMEDVRKSTMQPEPRERKMAELAHKIDLMTGKTAVQSIEDAKVLFLASDAPISKSASETVEMNKFVYWEGPFGFTADDYYFISRNRPDPMQDSSTKSFEIDGFSLHRIRKWFTGSDLQPGTEIRVVGRYKGKTDLKLANGQKVHVPLLEDCYVDRKSK
jgi:hypothetical protein